MVQQGHIHEEVAPIGLSQSPTVNQPDMQRAAEGQWIVRIREPVV